MNKTVLLMISAVAILSACASGPPSGSSGRSGNGEPEWLMNPTSAYPDEMFLSAVGSGDTRRAAEQDAAAGIAQIFESRVSVDMQTAERYQELVSGGSTLSDSEVQLTQSVSIRSDQTLLNVQFGESYTDSVGRVYVIGYLERLPTGRIYADLIQKNGVQVERFLDESRASGDIVREYAFMSAAAVVASNNEVLRDQLRIIAPGFGGTVQLGYDYDDLLREKADLAAKITVSVQVENDEGGRIAGAVREALSEERFPSVDNGVLSVQGSVRMESVVVNPDYKSVRWYLNLQMIGPDGRALVTYDNQERASGVSEEAAQAFAYADIQEAVQKDFVGAMRRYFDGMVLGN